MKKLNELQSYLTRLRGLMLTLIILCSIGSGNVWGAETLVYTLDGTVFASGNAYATATTLTQNSIGWSVMANTEQNPWRVGGKGLTNQDRAIYSTSSLSDNISKVEISSGATASSLTVNSLKLIVSTASNGSGTVTNTQTVTSGIASSTVTFERPSGQDWSGKYFKIVYNVTRTSTSGNGYITFNFAKFYKEDAPAYTITAVSNNVSYGTVSLSGSVITGSPNSGYRYASPAYTVTSGTATVSQIGNEFTVTPSSDCTVRINFESKGCTDHGASSITGGALSDDDHGPVHAYYDYSTSQFLYTKSDLDLAAGKKGTIKSIYFEYSGAAAMAARTIKIYMANTALTELTTSSYVPYASFEEVYDGSFSCSSAGWYEIILDRPFDYNGVGNLVVMVDDNTNAYEDNKNFKYHSATGAQIYKRQDDTDIDPASWTPASAINYRPNTKFCIQVTDMPICTVTLKDDDTELTQASAGASVVLPSRAGCSGYTFAGWTKTWVAPQSSWTTTAPTIIPAGSYTPEGNENLYPVYTKTESGGTTDYSKTETFENQGAGTTYNSTQTYTAANSNASLAWSMYYGTVSTNAILTGSKSAQMRWYSSATSNIPNIKTTTAVSGLQTLTFNAAVGNTNIKMKVEKSTDGSNWTVVASNVSMSTTKTEYSYDISGTIGTGYYIRIGVDGTNSTAPSSGNYTFRVDDVKFDYQEGGGSTTSYISVPACCTDWSTPTVTYATPLAINASEAVTISGTTHGAVTYESSDEDVLTVDADGTIHAVGAGTAHITATWAGDATYCEKSANSNDVTVSGIQVTGTTPVNFGQVYQGASIGTKTIYVTGLGLTNDITPSLPAGSPFSFSPASLAKDCSGATLTISASTATLGTYNQTLTLTSGAFSATVMVKMEVIAKPTATFTDALHNLTEDKDGVSMSSYNLTAAEGTPVVFPTLANQTKSAGTCEGEYYIFVGWTEGDNNTDPEAHLVTSHTLANGDTKNYYAVWADASGSATYTKLTSDAFKTSPTKYVLGGEDNGTKYFLYTYSSTDADLSWGECSSSEAPLQFTLSGEAGTLVAQDASGNYLAESSAKKKFRMSSTSATVQLQDDGTIETEYFYLRYNHNSGSGGLRYYESESSEPAYFYEVSAGGTVHYRTSCCANKVDAPVVTATAVTSTSITLTWPSDVKATGWQIEWNGAGGWVTPSGSCTHTVSGLTPNTTYTWRVRATYEDPVCGADVRSGSTTTNQVYHVTYAKGSGTGSCTASGSTTDETAYEAGATVTLQANEFSLSGHTFAGWTEDDDDITISSNQFTMPDHDVVITASWTAKMDKYFDRMHDQTDELHGGVEETEGTNEGKYYIPKEGCNYSVPTAVDSNTGDACQTSHYKLQGWIAASYVASDGTITQANLDAHLFSPTTRPTHTATGATYYAVWAEVTE